MRGRHVNNLIKAIEESLVSKNYLSALTLALVIPDICSKIAYPKESRIWKRYSDWYDEYIYKYENPKSEKELAIMQNEIDGKMIYKLRCALLHEGSFDIESDFREYKEIKSNQAIKFMLTNSEVDAHLKFYEGDKSQNDPHIEVRLSVVNLCKKICAVGENYYKEHRVNERINNDVVEFEF